MNVSSPIHVVRAFFDELSRGDLEAISRHASPEVVYVIYGQDGGTGAAVPWAGRHEGRGALKAAFSQIYGALRIEDFSIDTMFGEGAFVAIFGQYRASSVTTGRSFTTPFAQRAKVTDSLIVECLMSEDSQAVAAAIRVT